jgi:hypothetical protein
MAQYNAKQQFTIPRQIVLKNGVNVETLAGDKTLDKSSSMIQILDPDGAERIINLPPAKDGMIFWITNTAAGAFDLTVTKPDTSTIAVSQGEGMMIVADSVNWYQVFKA